MNLDSARAAFRRELGLPDAGDGRMVMTGHQCSLWHAGVLAKYLACDRMVPGEYDHAAWLWVDQDSDETHTVRVPVRANGGLAVTDWQLHAPPRADVAVAGVPAFVPAPFTGEPALPGVQAGIGAYVNALRRHADAPNAARQTAAALADLMSPLLRRPPPPAVFATGLMSTELGAALIARMRRGPRVCVEHYNDAVFAHPSAGVANMSLGDGEGGVELPLWRFAPSMPRQRVFARDLDDLKLDPRFLAPRALLMTGMVRMGACDLFVHGTGGGVYDRITEQWFHNWLGLPLAPAITVTADLLLPLHTREVSPRDVAQARWRVHHARHDPALLQDPDAAAEKARHLDAVRAAKSSGADPKPRFAEMHALLAASRQRHAARLAALQREADEAAALLSERAVATDRTWPFVFHGRDAIRAMHIRVTPPALA